MTITIEKYNLTNTEAKLSLSSATLSAPATATTTAAATATLSSLLLPTLLTSSSSSSSSSSANNVMAHKRKMYLCKRSNRLETQNLVADTSVITGNALPTTTITSQKTQNDITTARKTKSTSAAATAAACTSALTTTTMSSTTTATQFIHISHQQEHFEKLQQQMLEDCGLHPHTAAATATATIGKSVKNLNSINSTTTTTPALNCLKTYSNQTTSSSLSSSSSSSSSTISPQQPQLQYEKCSSSCTCLSNCHNCSSSPCCCSCSCCRSQQSCRTLGSSSGDDSGDSGGGCGGGGNRKSERTLMMSTSPSWETFDNSKQQMFPSKNSYYYRLSETKKETNDDCCPNKRSSNTMTYNLGNASTCISNSTYNSTPSKADANICCRNTSNHMSTPINLCRATTTTNACSETSLQFKISSEEILTTCKITTCPPTPPPSNAFVASSLSSTLGGKRNSIEPIHSRSTPPPPPSPPPTATKPLSFFGSSRRFRFLTRHLQRPYAILEMFIALLATATLVPKYTFYCNRRQQQLQKQKQQQYPQIEQRLMTHFNKTTTTTNIIQENKSNDNNDHSYYHCKRLQHQQQQRHNYINSQTIACSSLPPSSSNSRRQQMKQQVHHHHNRYYRYRYNYRCYGINSFLMITVLSLISLLLLFVPSSHASQTRTSNVVETTIETSLQNFVRQPRQLETPRTHVKLNRPEKVCKSMDIRNKPTEMRQLANCTVIEGFLLINLINGRSFEEYNETFPLLTEVTDFIIVYQVSYLRSLGQIFPNLSVIRGRDLFEGYALIVYFNAHLEDIGLPKLMTIAKGGVRIEKNDMLCFVKTINWEQIVVSNKTEIFLENNRDLVECPACPGDQNNDDSSLSTDLICKQHHGPGENRRYCWNSKVCQKICPERCRANCIDENTCCNESCMGGCSEENINECFICRNYSINNTICTDKCPPNYYSFLDRRCLTADECRGIGNMFENNKEEVIVPFDGMCSTRCPKGYDKDKEAKTCVKCTGKCMKTCDGMLIDGAARAKEMHGCNIIEGSLTIIIKRASQITQDLTYGLSQIEVITGYLKIQGTYGMFDLHFFKNLKTIQGKHLFEDKYAFYVLENTDMESIWNPNQNVMIENGTVYFHFNPKLCITEIYKLLPMLRNQTHFDKNEVAEDSNGSKGSCNTLLLEVVIHRLGSVMAVVNISNPITYDDERTFIGYQFLHMEDPYGNATKYGFRPCDDGWIVSEPSKEINYIFQGLKPFTQYAFYVKTMTISTERRNGQSPIMHFKTKSDQPSHVINIQGYANSSSAIVMNWLPPREPNGKLVKYKIKAKLDERIHRVESRNYCKDPLKLRDINADKPDKPILTPSTETDKPKLPQDCKCPKTPMGKVFNDDEVESTIHASIELENQLQNFIYVKKPPSKMKNISIERSSNRTNAIRNRRELIEGEPSNSFMLRHIRQVPRYPLLGSATIQQEVKESRMDKTETYYEFVTSSVNASINEFVFTHLKHFSWYTLGIEACRESEEQNNANECSREVKIYVRTKTLPDVDKVEKLWAKTETTNSSRTNVRLFWEPPANPNGAVVSYTILYEHQSPDAIEEKKCITEVDFIELDYQNNGYVIKNLQSGNYSIRIRTNTLAGEGLFSEKYYVYIPPNTLAPSIIAGIAVGAIVLILLIGAAIYLLFRKRLLAPPSDLKIFPSVNPHYISLQYIPDEWEVARDQIIQLSPLGQGSFGMVYEGILKGEEDTPCAIKTVNENATDRERMNFLNEACVMKQFDTYHVVRLLGVCSRGQPALVIMELMKNGDLKSYLRAHRPDERGDEIGHRVGTASQPPPLSRIYQMAIEIADGMAYLAAKKFVHRDLAARNCMVAADLTVKIGDFGMTRDIYENDYYRKGTKGLLPVRWMPPESLRDGVYSTASDVFSYGVVLWEMATLASQPYQGLANDQVLRYVIDGGVMERPENCPDKLYGLMQKCWHHRPSARPTFIEIIRFLFDLADPHFREVSFYNSEEGQHILAKEVAERNQRSGDVFDDPDNDMEDVTTPLRLEEYGGFKLNNSSMGHRRDSSMAIDDDGTHSPYSMGSPMVVSSTPDEQSRGSYNMSRILHNQLLNSAPSTSAGLRKLGSSNTSSQQLTHPHTHPHHRNLYQPTRFSQQQQQQTRHQHHPDDVDAYVQPDFEPNNDEAEGIKRDSDEQGYEIYDPSPNYREHVPRNVREGPDDDEDDFGVHSTAAENLLVRPKGRTKQPTIMPLSTSMPDEVIGQPTASSLHPSTASAASSNASSSKAGTGKYPSLRAVADSLGNSIMPNRLRMMNMRLFNHKRSGSNASHKSTSSNPNSTSGVGGSINNLARSGRGKSMSGQNLGTIESGGSGSAGSYSGNPRFFSTSSSVGASDNPNYRRLDDSSADTSMSGAVDNAKTFRGRKTSTSTPSYKMLDESLNTTGASVHMGGENPNYEIMQPPAMTSLSVPLALPDETASSYVMMNEPAQKRMPDISAAAMHENDNPNYQLMCPLLPTTSSTIATITPATVLPTTTSNLGITAQRTTSERSNKYSPTSSSLSSSSGHESDDEDHHNTKDNELERKPLSRRSSNDRSQKRHNKKTTATHRSRSQSSNSSSCGGKSSATTTTTTNTASTIIPTGTTTTTQTSQTKTNTASTPSTTTTASTAASVLSAKEKWWKESQPQSAQPPPNGFVGREA